MGRSALHLATAVALVVALLGCGDDDDSTADAAAPPDASIADARTDAVSQSMACSVLCNCTLANCSQDATECLAECDTLSASARACRIEHCGYAGVEPLFHCPHARGEEICN
jgi:hypothetical protein